MRGNSLKESKKSNGEDKKVDVLNEPLFRERSYARSISTGMRLPLRHPWGFLRQLWPLLLLSIVVFAVVSKWFAPDLWIAQHFAFLDGITTHDLFCKPSLRIVLWGILPIGLLGVMCGQVAYLLQRYGELNYLPAVAPWKIWKDILPLVGRGILLCLFGYVVTVGLAALSLLLPHRYWALACFVPLVIVWAFYYVPVGQQFMLGQKGVGKSLAWPFLHFDLMGGTTAILVVCGLLVTVVILMGCIPAICSTYVGGLSAVSVAVGDGTDLPHSFVYLRAAGFGLAALVAFFAWLLILVPLCFQWGSTEKKMMADRF